VDFDIFGDSSDIEYVAAVVLDSPLRLQLFSSDDHTLDFVVVECMMSLNSRNLAASAPALAGEKT
jgi:hypothetical protein